MLVRGLLYLMKGCLGGAIAEVGPVLALPASMRVASVTAYTERLSKRLQQSRHNGAAGVHELRQRLALFSAEALSGKEP
jgi:hypothetical protein